jgi:hypothetical protein
MSLTFPSVLLSHCRHHALCPQAYFINDMPPGTSDVAEYSLYYFYDTVSLSA